MTAASVPQLASLTRLRTLNIMVDGLNDAALEPLAALKDMRYLLIGRKGVTDRGLKHVSGMSKLRTLILERATVRGAGLAHLSGLPLRKLELSGTKITDLSALGTIPTLRRVYLNRTRLGDAQLQQLATLPELARLKIARTRVTDAGLAHLSGATKLESLELTGTAITAAGLRPLAGLTNLVQLFLNDTRDGADLPSRGFAALRYLRMHNLILRGMAFLPAYPLLRTLDVSRATMTDAAPTAIAAMPRLFEVTASLSAITPAWTKALAMPPSPLPALRLRGGTSDEPRARELATALPLTRLYLNSKRVRSHARTAPDAGSDD